jgi:hypothetical protein
MGLAAVLGSSPPTWLFWEESSPLPLLRQRRHSAPDLAFVPLVTTPSSFLWQPPVQESSPRSLPGQWGLSFFPWFLAPPPWIQLESPGTTWRLPSAWGSRWRTWQRQEEQLILWTEIWVGLWIFPHHAPGSRNVVLLSPFYVDLAYFPGEGLFPADWMSGWSWTPEALAEWEVPRCRPLREGIPSTGSECFIAPPPPLEGGAGVLPRPLRVSLLPGMLVQTWVVPWTDALLPMPSLAELPRARRGLRVTEDLALFPWATWVLPPSMESGGSVGAVRAVRAARAVAVLSALRPERDLLLWSLSPEPLSRRPPGVSALAQVPTPLTRELLPPALYLSWLPWSGHSERSCLPDSVPRVPSDVGLIGQISLIGPIGQLNLVGPIGQLRLSSLPQVWPAATDWSSGQADVPRLPVSEPQRPLPPLRRQAPPAQAFPGGWLSFLPPLVVSLGESAPVRGRAPQLPQSAPPEAWRPQVVWIGPGRWAVWQWFVSWSVWQEG